MAREGAIQIEAGGERLTLDPRRGVYWDKRRALIIADPHIGKDDTFRRAGIPVPAKVASSDFARLSALINDYTPDQLVVLGDFLHARQGPDDACLDTLRTWRDQFASLDVMIVRGNHDVHAGPPPSDLGLVSVDEPSVAGPFVYRHFPCETDRLPAEGFVLAGHLHPGVTVVLDRYSAKRVPCFHVTDRQAVLPAFGSFTGTARISASAPGMIYAAGRDRVIPLPRPAMA